MHYVYTAVLSTYLWPYVSTVCTFMHYIVCNGACRIFWEMATAVMNMPILATQCTSGLSGSSDLAVLMKRPEYRILWTPEAPALLPKDVACDIISASCVGWSSTGLSGHGHVHGSTSSNSLSGIGKTEG